MGENPQQKRFRIALTYGTFDLFHVGHVRLLRRIAELADRVYVGVSSDDFNKLKSKILINPYEARAEVVESCKYVDYVFPELTWDQKSLDCERTGADVLVMGSDWEGRFDDLSDRVKVIYLPRTPSISTTLTVERINSEF